MQIYEIYEGGGDRKEEGNAAALALAAELSGGKVRGNQLEIPSGLNEEQRQRIESAVLCQLNVKIGLRGLQ